MGLLWVLNATGSSYHEFSSGTVKMELFFFGFSVMYLNVENRNYPVKFNQWGSEIRNELTLDLVSVVCLYYNEDTVQLKAHIL